MNFYIDFDNTLYETGRLTKDTVKALADTVASNGFDLNEVLQFISKSYNHTLDNFFDLAQKLTKKYGTSYNVLESLIIDYLIKKGENYVFSDSVPFLDRLKASGEKICILTYSANQNNLDYQALKLAGSKLLSHVPEFYITTRYKYELEIDYKNGRFIDQEI